MPLSDAPTETFFWESFPFLSPADAQKQLWELGIFMPRQAVELCRDLYHRIVRRPPIIKELRFLAAVVNACCQAPDGVRFSRLLGDAADADICRDLYAKRGFLGIDTPFCLSDLAALSGKALKQAGIAIEPSPLFVGTHEQAAILERDPAALSVQTPNAQAAVLHTPPTTPVPDLLFLFIPEPTQAAEQIKAFLENTRALPLSPLVVIGEEGLFPHLAGLSCGIDVDVSLFAQYTPEKGIGTLLEVGKHALLFSLPFNTSFAFNDPRVLLFGSRTQNDVLFLREGRLSALGLPREFLRRLCLSVLKTVTPTPITCAASKIAVAENEELIFGGIDVGTDACRDVLTLAAVLATRGADLRLAQFATLLQAPRNDESATSCARALPLLLGFHRASAALTIPSRVHLTKQNSALPHPCLSVFLLARKGAFRTDEEILALQNAAKQADAAALRRLFFGKN